MVSCLQCARRMSSGQTPCREGPTRVEQLRVLCRRIDRSHLLWQSTLFSLRMMDGANTIFFIIKPTFAFCVNICPMHHIINLTTEYAHKTTTTIGDCTVCRVVSRSRGTCTERRPCERCVLQVEGMQEAVDGEPMEKSLFGRGMLDRVTIQCFSRWEM